VLTTQSAGKAFTLGVSINYTDSIIVGKDGSRGAVASKQHLASKLPVGERFYSAQVVNQASATADQLTTRIPFTGAFRLLVFPGDVTKPEAKERLQKLADYLDSPESVVSKYTPSDLPRWAVIDPVTIRASRAVSVFQFGEC
jgi:phenol 2-monooxygenase